MKRKKILALVVTIGLAVTGCSLIDSPEVPSQGVIVLQLSDNGAATASLDAAMARALPTADSLVVKVYRPGSGTVPEVSQGVALNPPTSTTQVALTVIAEANKRVAVELFQSGLMTFFGVDENVDVVKDQNTAVSITARVFQVPSFGRDIFLVDDATTFNLIWSSTPGATFYRFHLSQTPDFSVINVAVTVVDTFLQVNGGTLPGGDWYCRVAAENIYTQSEFVEQFVHVYAAPVISGVSAPEVLRSQTVQVDVFGDHLDYPATQVTMFGQTANILSSSVDHLLVEVQVPFKASSDVVTVSNLLGTGVSIDYVRVQTIAYIMNDILGDGATASAFEQEIESYWETVSQSAVRVLSKSFIVSPVLFDVVIIGWDTAKIAGDWQGLYQSQADAIAQSGAMVLGMGTGGAAYFESVGLNIGLASAQSSNQTEVYVIDPTEDIYSIPNALNMTAGSLLNVYSRSLPLLSVPFSNGISPFATAAPLLLMHPLVEQDVITIQGPATNFLWGFDTAVVDPVNMTLEGAQLFENVVVYLFTKAWGGVLPGTSSR